MQRSDAGVPLRLSQHGTAAPLRLRPYQTNPFEQVVQPRSRPGYLLEPLSIAWPAVAFAIHGSRDAVASVPRAALVEFLDDLDAGRLDDTIMRFLATPPAGRLLRSAAQAANAGLFDEIVSPDAIVPPERVPGRPRPFGIGGRGGKPADARDHKGRRRRPRRMFLGAGLLAIIAAAAGVVVLTHRGSSGPTALAAKDFAGTYSLTETITVGNANLPVGTVDHVELTIEADCGANTTVCTLKSKSFTNVDFSATSIKLVGTATEPCLTDPTISVTDDFDIELRATQFDTRTGRRVPTHLEGTKHISSRVDNCPTVVNQPVTFSEVADRKP